MARAAGSERRRVGRHPIAGVQATLRAPGDVEVLDVSVFGMSIATSDALAPGDVLFLELRHGGQKASVEVAVQWAQSHRAGVEFRDVHLDRPGGVWDFVLVPDRLRD